MAQEAEWVFYQGHPPATPAQVVPDECDNVRQGAEKQFLYKIALNAQLEQKSAIKVSVHLSPEWKRALYKWKKRITPQHMQH